MFKTNIIKNKEVVFPIDVDLEDNSFFYTYVSNCRYAYYMDKYFYNYVQRKNSTFEKLLHGDTDIVAPRLKNLVFMVTYFRKMGILKEKDYLIRKLLSSYFQADYNNAKEIYKVQVINVAIKLALLLYSEVSDNIDVVKNPKVSIIVPVYNTTSYLIPLLGSIYNQTLKSLEIIFINDNSIKETSQILNAYSKIDPRVRIITNDENKGAGYCRNRGLEIANGEYIGFVDSDDVLSLDYYEYLYNKAIKTSANIVSARIFMCENNKTYNARWIVSKNTEENTLVSLKDKLSQLYINSSSSACKHLFNRSFIISNNIKFLSGYFHEDQYFILQAFYYANKIVTESKNSTIYYYYVNKGSSVHQNQISDKYEKCLLDQLFVIEKIYEFLCCHEVKTSILKIFYEYFKLIILQNLKYMDKKYTNSYKQRLHDLKIDKRFKNTLEKYLKFKNEKFIEKLFSIRNDDIRKIITICGIKFKFKSNTLRQRKLIQSISNKFEEKTKENKKLLENQIALINNLKQQFNIQYQQSEEFQNELFHQCMDTIFTKFHEQEERVYYNTTLTNLIIERHKKVFPQFKNINTDKDVAIIASGPTLKYYSFNSNNTVYIGVNKTVEYSNKLNYVFTQDYNANKEYLEKILNYQAKIFLGDFFCNDIPWISKCILPQKYKDLPNIYHYISNYSRDYCFPDISTWGLVDYGSVTFPALHFAFYTNPKRIYLVGCDCSSGYFDNEKETNDCSFLVEGYQKFKQFRDVYYPETEIISVNPVGLKGIFKDVYTEAYLLAHPEIKEVLADDVEILTI